MKISDVCDDEEYRIIDVFEYNDMVYKINKLQKEEENNKQIIRKLLYKIHGLERIRNLFGKS